MRKQSGFGHIGILLIIIVLAVVAGGGWYVRHHNKKAPATQQSPAKVDLSKYEQQLSTALEDKYKGISFCPSLDMATKIRYRATGYNFVVELNSPKVFIALCSHPEAGDFIASHLRSTGFNDVNSQSLGFMSKKDSYYASSNAVCQLTKDRLLPNLILACDYNQSFINYAKRMSDFAQMLTKETGIEEKILVLGWLERHNANNGNEYAELLYSFTNKSDSETAYFYRNIGANTWYYYGSTQQKPNCNEEHAKQLEKLFGNVCS